MAVPVAEIYKFNKTSNPLFRQFVPILDRPSCQPGIPLLYPRGLVPLLWEAEGRDVVHAPHPTNPAINLVVATEVLGRRVTTTSQFNLGNLQRSRGARVPLVATCDGLPAGACQVPTTPSHSNLHVFHIQQVTVNRYAFKAIDFFNAN